MNKHVTDISEKVRVRFREIELVRDRLGFRYYRRPTFEASL